MICEDCGGLLTTERNAVRRYGLGGLPHVELHGVEVSQCSACGKESLAIPRIGQLHRMLAEQFVKQSRMLAPIEIRFLRKHIGMSTVDFGRTLGVTRETVSRWETGATPIGAVADRLIRVVVLTHEPAESYAVEDLLRELTDTPAPERLTAVAMRNSRDGGWRSTGRKPAKA